MRCKKSDPSSFAYERGAITASSKSSTGEGFDAAFAFETTCGGAHFKSVAAIPAAAGAARQRRRRRARRGAGARGLCARFCEFVL